MSHLKLVAWSGGCDSTLALYEAITQQKTWVVKEGDERTEVRAFSVNWAPIYQGEPQRQARKRIKRELNRRGLKFSHVELDLTQSTPGYGERASQAVLWVSLAQTFLANDEDLVTGWIRGDDVWHHIGELRAAFEALRKACGRPGSELVTPLEWDTKAAVIRRLEAAKLLELCWWCEDPRKVGRRFEPCKVGCVPCRTHAAARYALDHYPPAIREQL